MHDDSVRKHLVNLTVHEALLSQPRSLTDNRSNGVEAMLTDHVGMEQQARESRAKECSALCATWNRFNDAQGPFANGDSPL
jgi:hypothetical protein